MKKISFIFLVLFAAGFVISTTSCGGEEINNEIPEPVDTIEDTMDVVTFDNSVQVGFDIYNLDVREDLTFGFYDTVSMSTTILVSGNDGSNGDADFTITVPGNDLGTFNTDSDDATFTIGTGTVGNVRRLEYNTDGTNMTIELTEYGEVGEKISGTFSGRVKSQSSQTVNIENGKFSVVRR